MQLYSVHILRWTLYSSVARIYFTQQACILSISLTNPVPCTCVRAATQGRHTAAYCIELSCISVAQSLLGNLYCVMLNVQRCADYKQVCSILTSIRLYWRHTLNRLRISCVTISMYIAHINVWNFHIFLCVCADIVNIVRIEWRRTF